MNNFSEKVASAASPPVPMPTDPQSLFLMRAVGSLRIPTGFEQSFRVSRGSILPDRFAMWVDKKLLAENPDGSILTLCRRMKMPLEFETAMLARLHEAQGVLLGCERGKKSCVYKVYLDMKDKTARPQGPEPVLIFEAYKWDLADPSRRMVTTYQGYPWLRLDGMLDRIAKLYDQRCPECFQIAWSIAQQAAAKGADGDFRYMELSEANGRKSFVFNLYPARMLMAELAPQLRRVCQHFGVNESEFNAVVGPIGRQRPGWLGGGIHRNGEEFMSVYYGWEWWRYDLHPVAAS